MKKYKFRLERVLLHRESVKRDRLSILTRHQQSLFAAEAELDRLNQARLLVGIVNPEPNGSGSELIVSAEDIALRGLFGQGLMDTMEKQRHTIDKLQKETEIARIAFKEAATEAEALVKLKATQLKAYGIELSREEDRVIDELSTMKGAREPNKETDTEKR